MLSLGCAYFDSSFIGQRISGGLTGQFFLAMLVLLSRSGVKDRVYLRVQYHVHGDGGVQNQNEVCHLLAASYSDHTVSFCLDFYKYSNSTWVLRPSLKPLLLLHSFFLVRFLK